MALGAPWCPQVPQNAIGVIKINDFPNKKNVPEGVRASMREPHKTALSSQMPGAPARLRKSWRLPFVALGFPRETSTRPRGPYENERFASAKHTFQTSRGTAGTPQVTRQI